MGVLLWICCIFSEHVFSKEHIWTAASKGSLFTALCITTWTVCQCTFIYHVSIITNFFFSFNILSIFFFYFLSSTIFNFIHNFLSDVYSNHFLTFSFTTFSLRPCDTDTYFRNIIFSNISEILFIYITDYSNRFLAPAQSKHWT